jgi:hypothetical protein
MNFRNRPFLLRLARMASVTFALAALASGVLVYSPSSILQAAGKADTNQMSNIVEVCSDPCAIIAVSNTSARFQVRAGSRQSQLGALTLPFDVSCLKSCKEIGGDPEPGARKTIFAEKQREPYAVTFVDLNERGAQQQSRLKILAEGTCIMQGSKSGLPGRCGYGAAAESDRPVSRSPVSGDAFLDGGTMLESGAAVDRSFTGFGGFGIATASQPIAGEGVIAGRIELPGGKPAAGITVTATSAQKKGDAVTGRWVKQSGVASAPWRIELWLNGNTVTGSAGQTNNGIYSPQPIDAGFADGNTVSFRSANMGAGARRRVTFTGTIDGDQLTLNRAVEILPAGRTNGRGLFGANGPAQFTAVRDRTVIRVSAVTDVAGQYRIRNLPPGHYQISAGPSETPTNAELAPVGPGEKASVNLRLSAAPERAGASPSSPQSAPSAADAWPPALPNTVLICKEPCAVVEAPASATYQFGAGGRFNTVTSPLYPLVVDCTVPCSQLGAGPHTAGVKGLYAMQLEKDYTVMWKDASGTLQPPATVPALPPPPRPQPLAPPRNLPAATVGPGGG